MTSGHMKGFLGFQFIRGKVQRTKEHASHLEAAHQEAAHLDHTPDVGIRDGYTPRGASPQGFPPKSPPF
jgi:hypothetical protein